MLYSAIGYILTLFMAFTIIPLLAFFMRMVLVMVLSKIYWTVTKDKSPAGLLQFSIKSAQPVGFATAIFHGYAALWMGFVLLKGLDVPIDFFLAGFLGMCFLWFGIKRIKAPTDIKVKNNLKFTGKDGEEIIIIDSEEESTGNPMEDMNKQLQDKLKEKTAEFMQGNTVIGLIGKLTGVVIGTMSHIVPHIM